MDMECGRNVTDDPFVPKIVVENLQKLPDRVWATSVNASMEPT